jgi:hypothetical protein
MISWQSRTSEERGLLNPSFCGMLLWHAAYARERDADSLLTLEEAFLILPFVLHRQTREDLPRTTRTSLAVWLDEHPLARGRVSGKATLLVPYTKEALTFAGVHGLIRFEANRLRADDTRASDVASILKESSDEVKLCAKRAEFIAKWFAQAGNAATVLALIGVRP